MLHSDIAITWAHLLQRMRDVQTRSNLFMGKTVYELVRGREY